MSTFDENLAKVIADALSQTPAAQRSDLLKNYPMTVTVSDNWWLYANPRVTAALDGMWPVDVTHLFFTPIIKAGIVVARPCEKDAPGAEEFVRNASRRTGSVNAKAALNGFNLTFPENRKMRFTVMTGPVVVEGETKEVMVIKVKAPTTHRKEKRPRRPKAETPPPATTPTPDASAPGAQPDLPVPGTEPAGETE